MAENKVIIIGAGLGGLTLAQCLRKRGIPFEIYERDETDEARAQGWALALHWVIPDMKKNFPNDMPDIDTTSVFKDFDESLNLDDSIMTGFYDLKSGELLMDLSVGLLGGQFFRCNRSRLRKWLSTNIKIHWGKRFARYEETEEGISAIFEDGEIVKGRILVGADGIHSRVRTQLFSPDSPKPDPIPLCILGAHIDLQRDQYVKQLALGKAFTMALVPGESVFFCGLTEFDPVTDVGHYYWLYGWRHEPNDPAVDTMRAASKEEQLEFVRAKLIDSDAHPKFKDLLNGQDVSLMAPPLLSYTLPPQLQPPNSSRRVQLLGDAAHGVTLFRGQGANHAILDATKLAGHLAVKEEEDWKSGLVAYEKEMVKRGGKAVAESLDAAIALSIPKVVIIFVRIIGAIAWFGSYLRSLIFGKQDRDSTKKKN